MQKIVYSIYNSVFSSLRFLYEKTIAWADHRYSVAALSIIAFIESIFFPIPPDALLVPMGISRSKKAFHFAFICSVFSILGGTLAYAIGYYFWQVAESFFLPTFISVQKFQLVEKMYQGNIFLVVFSAAFTPIPFKVFTLSAGVFHISFGEFFLGMLVGRPARFFLVGATLFFFGEKARFFLEKYFNLITILVITLLVAGILASKWMF